MAKGGNQDMRDTLPLPFKSSASVGGGGRHYLLHLYLLGHMCGEVLMFTCRANQCTNAEFRLYSVFLVTEPACPPRLIMSLCNTSRPRYSFFSYTLTGFGQSLHTPNLDFANTS